MVLWRSVASLESCVVIGLEKVRGRKQVIVLTEQFLKIGTMPLGAQSGIHHQVSRRLRPKVKPCANGFERILAIW